MEIDTYLNVALSIMALGILITSAWVGTSLGKNNYKGDVLSFALLGVAVSLLVGLFWIILMPVIVVTYLSYVVAKKKK